MSGIRALRRRIEATLPLNKNTRDEWKVRLVFWSMAAVQPELRRQQERRFLKAVAFFERDIVAAIEAGEISDCGDTTVQARHLVNMTTGISTAALHHVSLYNKSLLLHEIDFIVERLASAN